MTDKATKPKQNPEVQQARKRLREVGALVKDMAVQQADLRAMRAKLLDERKSLMAQIKAAEAK